MKSIMPLCRPGSVIGAIVISALAFCMVSCAPKDDLVSEKLTVILEDDLQALLDDLPQESHADSPFYEIELFETGKPGRYLVSVQRTDRLGRTATDRVCVCVGEP